MKLVSQVQNLVADELSGTSGVNKWTCKCSSTSQGNQSYALKSNCSTSCDCLPGMLLLLWYMHPEALVGMLTTTDTNLLLTNILQNLLSLSLSLSL